MLLYNWESQFQKILCLNMHCLAQQISFRYGLVVRIAGSHPAGPGSIPGNGKHFSISVAAVIVQHLNKTYDEDGIRTHAGRAHWISSPTP